MGIIQYYARNSKNSSATILEQSTSPFDMDGNPSSLISPRVPENVQEESSQLSYSELFSSQERNRPHPGRIDTVDFEFSEQAEKKSPQEEDVDVSRFLAADDEEGKYSPYWGEIDAEVAQYLAPDDQEGYYRSLEEEEEELNQPRHVPEAKVHKWTNNDRKELFKPMVKVAQEFLKYAVDVNANQVPLLYAVQDLFLTSTRKFKESINCGEGTCGQGSSNSLRQTIAATVVRFFTGGDTASHQVHDGADCDVLNGLNS